MLHNVDAFCLLGASIAARIYRRNKSALQVFGQHFAVVCVRPEDLGAAVTAVCKFVLMDAYQKSVRCFADLFYPLPKVGVLTLGNGCTLGVEVCIVGAQHLGVITQKV